MARQRDNELRFVLNEKCTTKYYYAIEMLSDEKYEELRQFIQINHGKVFNLDSDDSLPTNVSVRLLTEPVQVDLVNSFRRMTTLIFETI